MGDIDVEIGRRLRALRWVQGMSMEQLAARIGVTHQQIQRYEAGSDRLPASRLFEFARLFDVPVGRFFETVRLPQDEQGRSPAAPDGRGLRLAREFEKLPEAQKRAVLSLVQSLSFMQSAWDAPDSSRRRDGS